jgi:hypothetical protein
MLLQKFRDAFYQTHGLVFHNQLLPHPDATKDQHAKLVNLRAKPMYIGDELKAVEFTATFVLPLHMVDGPAPAPDTPTDKELYRFDVNARVPGEDLELLVFAPFPLVDTIYQQVFSHLQELFGGAFDQAPQPNTELLQRHEDNAGARVPRIILGGS